MGKRNDFMCFPGGKHKALTLSYDDGVTQDRRLVALFNRYGVKGTFNLGLGVLGFQGEALMAGRSTDISKVSPEEVGALYAGHEVAGHGLWHSFLNNVGSPLAMYELIEDKAGLEKLTGGILRSFAYPFGTFSDETVELLRLAGYAGARTVKPTHGFSMPEDFLRWDPTCHHNDPELMELAQRFCTGQGFGPQLFYLWGHAYEFDADDNWGVMEEFLQYVVQFRDDIWFATNGEITEYCEAFGRRVYSADGSRMKNPTATDIWLTVGWKTVMVPAGKTVEIDDPGL